ncbi:MAG: ABC transporter permease [Oscillospiraceae bacterium]|nr:ABC transporter permease [Oscillospiraceae bacterium]
MNGKTAANLAKAPQGGNVPIWKKINPRMIFPALGLIMVVLIFQIFSGGRLLTANNLRVILNDVFPILVGASAYAFILSQGNLDFSIGATMGVSAAVAALAAGITPILALPAGIIVGAVIGAINGFSHAVLKINAFIATLAMQFILGGVILIILRGGVFSVPLVMLSWNTMTLRLSVLFAVLIAGYLVFQFTPYGKYCRALGSGIEAARQTGVNITLNKFIPFVVMGATAGLLSFFSIIRTATVSSHTGGDLLMSVLNAVLLGGIPITGGATSRFRAVIIGSLTIAFLNNGMILLGFVPNTRQLLQGVIFLMAIAISFDRKNTKVIK